MARAALPVLVDDDFELLVVGSGTVGNAGAGVVDVMTTVRAGDWVMPAALVAAGKTDVTISVVGGGADVTGLLTDDVNI